MKLPKSYNLFFALAGLVISSSANANSYTCLAKENANRGFNSDFEISITQAAVGGEIVLKADGRDQILGKVTEEGTLTRADAAQEPAFEATLGLIAEEDVSGVAPFDLNRVDSLQVFRAEIADGDEVLVYRLFEKTQQVGGTIMISGAATACLP